MFYLRNETRDKTLASPENINFIVLPNYREEIT